VIDLREMLHWVSRYLSIGWAVTPLDPGKKLLMPSMQSRLGAIGLPWLFTTDLDEVKRWFGIEPNLNIGIMLAESGLTVIDVDDYEAFAPWLALHEYPHGPSVKTPHGYHFYCRANEDEFGVLQEPGGKNVGDYLTGKAPSWKVGPVYVVAPPSEVDGQRYEWRMGRQQRLKPVRPVPDWVREGVVLHLMPASWFYDEPDGDDEDDWMDVE